MILQFKEIAGIRDNQNKQSDKEWSVTWQGGQSVSLEVRGRQRLKKRVINRASCALGSSKMKADN